MTRGGVTLPRTIEIGVSAPFRMNTMFTVVPSGPLILFATSSEVRPSMSSPLTVLILSPFFTPALSAGLFGKTWATSTRSFGPGDVIVAPIPEYSCGGALKPLARDGSR